jgi:hypothetical protein
LVICKDMRGHEQALLDLHDDPELAHYCIDQILVHYQSIALEARPTRLFRDPCG